MSENGANSEQQRVLTNSAVMAAGTVVSRLSGFVRSTLLMAALGAQLHADVFNIANTIPNMLYILLAGGVFNAVLVPQLVRAMRNDPDGGEAYTNRIVTLAALFLGVVTVLLIVAAPWVMSLLMDPAFQQECLRDQRESVIDFARYCLPQVFFYGMFVLLGQILNARGKFGPMMWAPIANNIISVAVLITYLLVFGPAKDLFGGFSPGQELLLGIGATVGIAAQFLVLVPYLRQVGYSFRPRFDFLHSGLSHTLRLGVWTVLFVIVNQIAYAVVVRLASSGTASVGCDGRTISEATGYTVYSGAFLIVMVPHSVITVSLATAILPGLSARAADRDFAGLARSLAETMRTALAVVIPFALLLPFLAGDIANVVWGHGATADGYELFVPSLTLFGIGLAFFTVHYLMLRGFYALERTDVVFWIQCAVAATNIVVAVVLVTVVESLATAPALVLAYSSSYVVGAALSYGLLRRRLGGLDSARLVRFLVRLLIASGLAAAAAAGTAYLVHRLVGLGPWTSALVSAVLVTAVGGAVLVGCARAMRLEELTSMIDTVTRRLPVPRRR